MVGFCCNDLELAGIVFLSGGQSDEDATIHLNLINQIKEEKPWPLSFSYGRSIQRPALKIWAEDKNKVVEAQAALMARAKYNGMAALGEYHTDMEK